MFALYWIAHYADGSQTDQRQGATYRDIDRQRLIAFGLYREDQPVIVVDFDDDTNGDSEVGKKRLIWRKRHSVDSGGSHATVHLIGWQRKIRGRNVQSICYVTEEGAVVMGGQWIENRPLMHAVKPLEWEADLAD